MLCGSTYGASVHMAAPRKDAGGPADRDPLHQVAATAARSLRAAGSTSTWAAPN